MNINRFGLLILSVVLSFMFTACTGVAQDTSNETTSSSADQLTATMTSSLPPSHEATHMIEYDLNPELPEGDSERGFTTAIRFRCYGCHIDAENGLHFDAVEDLPNIMERGEMHIADPAYEGNATSNLEYIMESIYLPEVYIVPGEWGEPMPVYLGQTMSEQDLANIFAWMRTFK